MRELVGELEVAVEEKDWDAVERISDWMQERFKKEEVGRLAVALSERMGEWSDVREGAVYTDRLVDVLRDEGVEV